MCTPSVVLRKSWRRCQGACLQRVHRKSDEIGASKGANHSQVRPRTAKQGPRLRGCDPGAGCKRIVYAAFLCTPLRSHPQRGPCSTLRCAHLARICNTVWRRFSSSFVPGFAEHYTKLDGHPPCEARPFQDEEQTAKPEQDQSRLDPPVPRSTERRNAFDVALSKAAPIDSGEVRIEDVGDNL